MIPTQKNYQMPRKHQILVIGHNDSGCTPEHEKVAYETGAEIAKSDAVLISGGLGGVMRASCHGAHDAGGFVVGIIPQDDHTHANEFCDVVVPSGMGLTRDFLNALAADGVIIVGGGSGTLSEVCAAYMHKRPMVAIKNTGGTADKVADGFIDHRENVKIIGVDSPKEAVELILERITA